MTDLRAQDAANRLEALELRSFIVEAPAGAGKTELLTQRYLKLLAVVQAPEEIIALTFTNKATAEMRSRILQSLQDAADNVPIEADKPHKQQTRTLAQAALQRDTVLSWHLLKQPARLRIQTIDALCGSLTQQMPLLSRFGGQPALADDATPFYLEAAQRTLADVAAESATPDAPISTVLAFMQNQAEKLTALLADMLAKRDQWLLPLGNHVDEAAIAAQTRAIVHDRVVQALQEAAPQVPDAVQQALMPTLRYAAANHPTVFDLSALQDWQTPLPAMPNALSDWLVLCDFLMTKEGEFRKIGGLNVKAGFPKDDPLKSHHLENFARVCEVIRDTTALQALRTVPVVDEIEITRNAKLVAAFATTLKLAAAHLWTVFQAENVVDFVEVTRSAIQALASDDGPSDLALRLDYRIAHLLVDEFQDTSPTQIALLKAITQGWQTDDGRTLFCVGDPMQSIYRFRKADVGEFLNARLHGIGHIHLQPLKLSLNNRSRPEILTWVNNSFAQIFPPHDQPEAAAIAYRKCEPKLEAHQDAGVSVHALVTEGNGEAAKMLEARHVARLIAQERGAKPEQTIAVLVRSRAHLQQLVSVMRREYPMLPFQAVEIESLNQRQTVLDALSLTRAMLHRADRVHWLAILRAPWCGLTLADLHRLCAHNHRATIWQLMHDETQVAQLTPDGRARLLRLRILLTNAFAAQGRMPLRRWLENTWLQLGGGSTLLNAGDIRDVQAFFDLVEKTAKSYTLDFAQLDAAMEGLYAKPDAGASERLQFLTIHKSKGLEFDCVILPALNAQAKNEDKPLILWQEFEVENQLQLLAAPITKSNQNAGLGLYDYLHKLEQARTRNESVRLLYVAATRAKERLHLVGTVIENQKGERKPHSSSLLTQLWPCVAQNFEAADKTPQNDANSSYLSSFSSQLLRLPNEKLSAALAEETLTSSHTSSAENEGIDAPDITRDMGTLAHLYLEILTNGALSAEKIGEVQPAMQRWLQQKGHPLDASRKATSQIIAALQTTLQSQDGQWVLQPHEYAQSEYALISADDQMHVIDRTFIANSARWVIDYKLGLDVTEANAEVVAKQQHSEQLARYAQLFTEEGLPIKQAILFLSLGKLIVLNNGVT